MNKFEVGEDVIIQSVNYPESNGIETKVTEVMSPNRFVNFNGLHGYRLDSDGDKDIAWCETALRKKKPPLSTWDKVTADTLWNPLKDEATV